AASEPCATCSSHGLLEEVGHALLCPLAIAWSYTHVPTARSRIPMPKGAKMIGRRRFTVVIRSSMSAGRELLRRPCQRGKQRQKRRKRSATGVEGKFYMDVLVTSTRSALRTPSGI